MIHRVSIRSNPRLLILGVIVVGLPAAGLALIGVHIALGAAAFAAAAILDYHLIRFAAAQFKSFIETDGNGIRGSVFGESEIAFRWSEITHAGIVRPPRGRRSLFLYAEGSDKLLMIPDEYSRFDELSDTVERNAPFESVNLEGNTTIQDHLKRKLRGE